MKATHIRRLPTTAESPQVASDHRPSPNPQEMRRITWRTVVKVLGIYTVVAIVHAGTYSLMQLRKGEPVPFGETVGGYLGTFLPWAILTIAIIALARRFRLDGPKKLKAIAVHTAACLLFQPAAILFWAVPAFVLDASASPRRWDGLAEFGLLLEKLTVLALTQGPMNYWIILGLIYLFDYYRRFREREVRAFQLEAQLSQARLDALRSQIHPHFLFNTLNSILTLIHREPGAAERTVVLLGDLLRSSLEADTRPTVSLSEELELLEKYLEIERTRFPDRLAVSINVSPEVLDAEVPHLVLQPLVENAVRHGIAPRAAAGTVTVEAAAENGMLRLVVADDGVGLAAVPSPTAGNGIGLDNTRRRLAALYGEEHTFSITSSPNDGTRVTIRLPIRLCLEAAAG